VEYCDHLVSDTNKMGLTLRTEGGFTEMEGFGMLSKDGKVV
jgi:hypothetical protein